MRNDEKTETQEIEEKIEIHLQSQCPRNQLVAGGFGTLIQPPTPARFKAPYAGLFPREWTRFKQPSVGTTPPPYSHPIPIPLPLLS